MFSILNNIYRLPVSNLTKFGIAVNEIIFARNVPVFLDASVNGNDARVFDRS